MEKTKILVVDDEAEICALFKDFLGLRNYDVYTAQNTKDALELFEKARPRVVFLDIRLGDGSGLDVLRKIRETGVHARVIMVTALDDDENIRQAKLLGADDYIAKPFTVGYLENLILDKLSYLSVRKKARPGKD